jgi:CRP-like cAMP-binding protein
LLERARINETQSLKDACFIKRSPLKINKPDEANLPLNYAFNCPNYSDDGQATKDVSVKPTSRPPIKARMPEIRARPFDREKDPPTQIQNLLPRTQQSKLRAIATVLEFQRGNSTVFAEGEDAHFVYAISAGIVRIDRHSEGGRRQILAFMLPGDLFGLPDGGTYVNSAETVCPSTLYRVPWQRLTELMRKDPEVQVALMVRVAFDLRQAQRRIIMLAQQNASQKLASFLLDFAQHTEFYDERRRLLTLPLTRFDLGDYLGIAPETVARTFARLEGAKLVLRTSARLVEIRDVDGLKSLVSGRRRRDDVAIRRTPE